MAGDAGALRATRSVVGDLLEGQSDDVRDVAMLLTDELVTNALVHGGGRFSLAVDVSRQLLRVSVGDRSSQVPRVLHFRSDGEHGRGMAFVDALATSWGTDQEPNHKEVWFELELDR